MTTKKIFFVLFLSIFLIVVGILVYIFGWREAPDQEPQTYNTELKYLEELHDRNIVGSPLLTLFLMSEYLNGNQHRTGIAFFEKLLNEKATDLTPEQKSLYLGSLGALRASFAERVPLLKRISWVHDTIDLLESARELSQGSDFTVRWLTGTVYAQLPERFGKTDQAWEDLQWLLNHANEAPEAGMLREVYFQLASWYRQEEKEGAAQDYLALSGYESFEKPILLGTSYASNPQDGHTFHPQKITAVVPGKIFAMSGFEFTEYYFIVSEDGGNLISIDAGTRPDFAQKAHETLIQKYPNLPPLTTVFVTHAHWDHIGGHRYFRGLHPKVKFYARSNYLEEFEVAAGTRGPFDNFFGAGFSNELFSDYAPDVLISKRTKVTVGGTTFDLIPIPGGETSDGMFVYLPQYSTTFVGDFIMPYLGAPFAEEGNVPGLFTSIEILTHLNPTHVLHGHETLTRIFNPPAMLYRLKNALEWLEAETVQAIGKGLGRADIHHLNLIAPTVFEFREIQLVYLVLRENLINRVVDQHSGYWAADLKGMDYLNDKDYGAMLSHYLELSEQESAAVVENMIANGDHYLASRTATWALASYPESMELQKLKKKAFLKLKEKYQYINPFKTLIYSEMSGHSTPQLQLPE